MLFIQFIITEYSELLFIKQLKIGSESILGKHAHTILLDLSITHPTVELPMTAKSNELS